MIAAGTAGAGVSLVLAMTVLVVQLGAAGVARPGSNRPVVASQSGNSTGSAGGPGPTALSGARWTAGPAIASFHGTGPARNDHFSVGSPGTWGLSWAFICSARQPGNFTLTSKGTTIGDDVELELSGPAGRGITWNTRDEGDHSLAVSSDCSWVARVVLPKMAGRRQGSG